jgi:hypothetical protein
MKKSRRLTMGVLAAMVATAVATAYAQQSATNRYVPADKVPWVAEAGAPVRLGALWGDRARGEAGTLLSTPAGFHSGLHSHTADYWAVVVQGTWQHWVPSTGEGVGLQLEPGSHWTQVKTQLHEDACVSSTPCVIFLFNKAPYVTEYPRDKEE